MISLVIPVCDECESLRVLHGEIAEVARSAKLTFDVIFVDDGSSDGSWQVIADLAHQATPQAASAADPVRAGSVSDGPAVSAADPVRAGSVSDGLTGAVRDGPHGDDAPQVQVRGIRFRRNFGKAAALSAGFRAARGDIILTLDADLQDDPAEIPAFLAKLAEGYDVVSGWKRIRHDPWHKVWPSRLFNWLVSRLTRVRLHDHNCGMKCYRAAVFREVRLYGELHRFIPVLAAARGFKVGELEIRHRPRRFGRSKYGVRRFMKGFLDLLTVKFLTGFGQRPQHLLGGIGLISFLAGLAGMLYLGYTWIWRWFDETSFPPLYDRPLLIYAVAALLLGAQMMSIGFLAELITAYQSRDEDRYSIAEETPPN